MRSERTGLKTLCEECGIEVEFEEMVTVQEATLGLEPGVDDDVEHRELCRGWYESLFSQTRIEEVDDE